jgi:hypothetical protein
MDDVWWPVRRSTTKWARRWSSFHNLDNSDNTDTCVSLLPRLRNDDHAVAGRWPVRFSSTTGWARRWSSCHNLDNSDNTDTCVCRCCPDCGTTSMQSPLTRGTTRSRWTAPTTNGARRWASFHNPDNTDNRDTRCCPGGIRRSRSIRPCVPPARRPTRYLRSRRLGAVSVGSWMTYEQPCTTLLRRFFFSIGSFREVSEKFRAVTVSSIQSKFATIVTPGRY